MSGLAGLSAAFDANRVPILAAAGAGVVGFALYKRHQAATAPAVPAASAGAVSSGAQLAGFSGAAPSYDSTASDVYGLVQPQMEALGQQVSGLSAKLNSVPVSTPPAPTTPPPPKFSDGTYRVAGQDVVYLVGNGGTTRDWLTGNEYLAMGYKYGNDPSVQVVSGDDPRWGATALVGGNGPTAVAGAGK